MKKTMILAGIVMILGLVFTACRLPGDTDPGGEDRIPPELVGSWGIGNEKFLRINPNGTGTIQGNTVTWSIDGDRLIVIAGGESGSVSWEIVDGRLRLSDGEGPLGQLLEGFPNLHRLGEDGDIPPELVGSWGIGDEEVITINADGTGTFNGNPVTWSVDGDRLILVQDGVFGSVSWEIVDGSLRLSDGEGPLGQVLEVLPDLSRLDDQPIGPSLTGTVSIDGYPVVGQTLMANIAALAGTGTPSFRWELGLTPNFAPIPGATGSTFVVQAANVGQSIRVVVTRAGYVGEAIGGPTAVVSHPDPALPELAGTVSIDGDPLMGQRLTANIAALTGLGTASFQWERGIAPNFTQIPLATGSTYDLQLADVGYSLRVLVRRAGYLGYVIGGPTAIVTLPPLGGTVTLTGNAEVGASLTANTTGLGGTGAISHQWERRVGTASNFTAIAGATGQSYGVTTDDVGHTLRVVVTRANNSGSVASDPTAIVPEPSLPQLTGSVTITGIPAVVGSTLAANTAGLHGTGATSYQWERRLGTTSNFSPIPGATGSTYDVTTGDIGYSIRVVVERAGHLGSVESPPTSVVPRALAGTVGIDGLPIVGETLEANIEQLGGEGAPSFRWERRMGTASNFTVIAGATGPDYELRGDYDLGYQIRVVVTRANYSGSVASDPTPIVIAQGGGFTFPMIFNFQDMAPYIAGPTISILGIGQYETSATLTVSDPGSFDNIRWFFDGSERTWSWLVSGSHRENLTFGSNFHNNRVGPHLVTVVVTKDGVHYSRVITVTVVP